MLTFSPEQLKQLNHGRPPIASSAKNIVRVAAMASGNQLDNDTNDAPVEHLDRVPQRRPRRM